MKVLESKLENNTWTNGMYELTLSVDKLPDIKEEILFEDDTSKLVYGEDENGFVTFGSISKVADFGHRPGYRWSSRASVFNGCFNKQCMEITLICNSRKHGYSMNVSEALKYLPKGFYVIEYIETDQYGNVMEITYRISNTQHEKENQWYFEDVQYAEGGRRYISKRIYP